MRCLKPRVRLCRPVVVTQNQLRRLGTDVGMALTYLVFCDHIVISKFWRQADAESHETLSKGLKSNLQEPQTRLGWSIIGIRLSASARLEVFSRCKTVFRSGRSTTQAVCIGLNAVHTCHLWRKKVSTRRCHLHPSGP